MPSSPETYLQRLWQIFKVNLDPVSGSSVRLDFEHAKVHAGEMTHVYYLVPHASPLADNDNIDIVLEILDDPIHVLYGASGGGDHELRLFEDTQHSADGTVLDAHNVNKPSNKPVAFTARLNPTISDVGEEHDAMFVPGGSGFFAQGGAGERQNEHILAANTSALLRLTNVSGQSNQFSVWIRGYKGGPIE